MLHTVGLSVTIKYSDGRPTRRCRAKAQRQRYRPKEYKSKMLPVTVSALYQYYGERCLLGNGAQQGLVVRLCFTWFIKKSSTDMASSAKLCLICLASDSEAVAVAHWYSDSGCYWSFRGSSGSLCVLCLRVVVLPRILQLVLSISLFIQSPSHNMLSGSCGRRLGCPKLQSFSDPQILPITKRIPGISISATRQPICAQVFDQLSPLSVPYPCRPELWSRYHQLTYTLQNY